MAASGTDTRVASTPVIPSQRKISGRGNVERDRRNQKELHKQGWQVLVVWECETGIASQLERLTSALTNHS